MKEEYKRQVALLLDVLPEVAREDCFAMHGGTAINLFKRDMPRLSVDIDLTFVPVADRGSSFKIINTALSAIEKRVEKVLPGVRTQHQEKELKLLVSLRGVQIKIEVSQINRGCLSEPVELLLCDKAQEMFDAFVSESFTYSDYEHTRESLVKSVNKRLTREDKEFIFGFKRLEPDWNIYDFERFPAIQWKLENLRRFKQLHESGYREAVDRLDALLHTGSDFFPELND